MTWRADEIKFVSKPDCSLISEKVHIEMMINSLILLIFFSPIYIKDSRKPKVFHTRVFQNLEIADS